MKLMRKIEIKRKRGIKRNGKKKIVNEKKGRKRDIKKWTYHSRTT